MVIEIFKFENRTSDGENFLPIGRDDSPVYFVLYGYLQMFLRHFNHPTQWAANQQGYKGGKNQLKQNLSIRTEVDKDASDATFAFERKRLLSQICIKWF